MLRRTLPLWLVFVCWTGETYPQTPSVEGASANKQTRKVADQGGSGGYVGGADKHLRSNVDGKGKKQLTPP